MSKEVVYRDFRYPLLIPIFFGMIVPMISQLVIPQFDVVLDLHFDEIFGKGDHSKNLRSILLGVSGIIIGIHSSNMAYIFAMKKNFAHFVYKNAIITRKFALTMLSVAFPILVATLVFDYLTFGTISYTEIIEIDSSFKLKQNVDTTIMIVVFFSFFLFANTLVSDFKLKFSRICMKSIDVKSSKIEKMKYIILGIDSYSEYLRQKINLEINHLEKIYSKIATDSKTNLDSVVNELYDKLSSSDKLEATKYLSTYLPNDQNNILVRKLAQHPMKEWLPVIGALVSASILLINFLIQL